MKTAIFSDIHANLSALESVLSDARSQGVENFACLGDVVGYGPNPADCIALLQKIDCVCVKGNHDDDASNNRVLDNLNNEARQSLEWTRESLSDSQKSWLADLPYTRRLGRNLLVHAAAESPESWPYIRNKFDAQAALHAQSAPVCFFGHTHIPVSYGLSGEKVSALKESTVSLEGSSKFLVNVGSVGQPRDGFTEACYVVYDRSTKLIEYRRVPYDISQTVSEIHRVGLLPSLAERLSQAA